jgi:uncharacterized protein with GYD domain
MFFSGASANIFERRISMPTYITLLRYTQQGAAKVRDSPTRLDSGREAFKKLGVEIKDTYLTMGRYDLVCVIEGPDDESVAQALLTLGSQGNVQTETMRAWTEDEFRKITKSI